MTTVNAGAGQGYTITPNTNYHVADVLVDGVSVGAVTSFTFTNVTTNRTISATFAIDTHTITASAGANGSIAPSGVTTVNAGAGQGYTITPNAGYVVQGVLVDGISQGAVTSYSFTNVLANRTISASFVVDPTSTVSAGSPGALVTTVNPTVSVPVTLSRTATTPILGFSVEVTLSAGLTTSAAAITEGGFLTASGATTSFQIIDHGGGRFTIDGATLALPCGSSATTGTLFTIGVGSTLTGGTGTVTINSVTLRDCDNVTLASAIGTTASVTVDRSVPTVAVTSPNGGETWVAGSVHAITWTASDAEGVAANGVTLEYSANNGGSWLPVASGLANSGSFSWTIPNTPTASALVRATVADVNANVATDASNAQFTIQGTSTTTLASTPNPSVVGQSVTLTATVTPSGASGSVEFFNGATSLGLGTLTGGTATLATSTLAVGSHSLTAVYGGEPLYTGSASAATTQVVNTAATATSVSSSPNPTVFGQSTTLTATVLVTAPGAGNPTGLVTFFNGATSLGSAALSGGTASLATAALSTGAHTITASYAGDASFSASTSPDYTHTVNAASTTTSVASAPNPSLAGQSVAITATVAAVAPGAGIATGSVQFFDGVTLLGSASLSGGTATLNTSALSVGTHGLSAVYAGNASFTTSTSSSYSHVVNPGTTTTTVTSTPNPSVHGQSATFDVTVAVDPPAAGTATGTVELFDGAVSLGLATLSGGTASLSTSTLSTGAHAITAVYAGDASFGGSTSAAHTHTVNPAATATSVTSTPNPSLFGGAVTITATVATLAPGAGTAGGTVSFFDGVTPLGAATLSGGSASISTSTLSVGSHSLTAAYAGATDFSASTSAVHTHDVNTATTTTTVATSPNPSAFGESVAITATVSPAAASGSVEFFDGAISLGSAALSGGTATINTAAFATGAHSLTSVYAGDGTYTTSTSAVHTHTVNTASTATTVASTPNPSVFGQSVTLTANVSVLAPGSGTPSGTVTFFDGLTSLGSSALSGFSASISTSSLATGAHSITASFSGDASFAGSTSSASTHTVTSAATATSVTSTPNPSSFGDAVTLTASVTTLAPGAGVAGGSVTFFDGATPLGSATLAAGSAAISTSSLSVGAHSITASYAGSTDFSASTSAAHTHTVNAAASSVAVTTAPNPSVVGQAVAVTATVTPASATGSVEFFDGLVSLGTSPVSGGSASLNTPTLSLGAHNLTAVYSGDAGHSGSTSAAHTHTVNAASTTTTVASTPNPSLAGQSVAITATVAPVAPGAGSPGGSVEFFNGVTSLGLGTLSGGSATINTAALTVGTHSLSAVYAGSSNFTTSTSAAYSHVVNPGSTTTTVTSAPNPSTFGQSVAISVSVAANPPATGTASGNVELFDGVTSLGLFTLSGGTATFNTSAFAVGSHSLTATYAGDASFSGSSSAAHTHVVSAAASAVAVSTSPNPSAFGQSVAITASVTPASATGSVEFFDGLASLGTAPVSGGSALLNTSSLATGAHSLTAVYSGDGSYSGSTSATHSHTVNAASTTTTVASSVNPSTFGQSVTFTATVAAVAPGTGTPGGTVDFFDGATLIGSGALAAGVASFATSTLAAGSHGITAAHVATTNYSASTSATLTQVVNPAGSSVTLVAAPSPGIYQDNTTLTATVSPSVATGTVEFFDGVTTLGSSPVSSGTAVLVTSTLTVGVHSLTAAYSGDGSYSAATSAAFSLEVQARIVATAGPNGSITPAGTTLYSLGATPSFTLTADPGYHVASVTVDGSAAALTSPYTFGPISSNHTINVQFAVNPAVAAIATLSATQVRTGNDTDGTTRITLSWTPVPVGSTVEVWRKGFGNYPEYDDSPSPGSVPSPPAAYPPAGWTLTAVTAPGQTDEPSARDFYYYVAYVVDSYGTRSDVSNRTGGTLGYHLGDVSDGVTPGQGDNKVASVDLSLLGSNYGLLGAAVAAVSYLDVGPTTNLSVSARPTTDDKINFEDLVMFAINYTPVTSGPVAKSRPAGASADAVTLAVPRATTVGQDLAVQIGFTGTGRLKALAVKLAWDPAVVEPVSYTAGDAVLSQNGVVFSAEPGSVDGASFAGTEQGLVGEGEFATLHFRVKVAGDARITFASVEGRDSQNHAIDVTTKVAAVTPRTFTTAFAPAIPNPFGRTTMFQFSLAKSGAAELEVFSVDGRRVRRLASGTREAGEYRVEWNGTDEAGRPLSAGVYYARLSTAQGRFTRVVTYLR